MFRRATFSLFFVGLATMVVLLTTVWPTDSELFLRRRGQGRMFNGRVFRRPILRPRAIVFRNQRSGARPSVAHNTHRSRNPVTSNSGNQNRLAVAHQPAIDDPTLEPVQPLPPLPPLAGADDPLPATQVLRIADNRITVRASDSGQPEQSFVVLDDGEITLDGQPITLAQLAAALEEDSSLWAQIQSEAAGDIRVAKVIKGFRRGQPSENDPAEQDLSPNDSSATDLPPATSCKRSKDSCCKCFLCWRRARILRPFCRISFTKEVPPEPIVQSLPPLPELDELPQATELCEWFAPAVERQVSTTKESSSWQDVLWTAYTYLSNNPSPQD